MERNKHTHKIDAWVGLLYLRVAARGSAVREKRFKPKKRLASAPAQIIAPRGPKTPRSLQSRFLDRRSLLAELYQVTKFKTTTVATLDAQQGHLAQEWKKKFS